MRLIINQTSDVNDRTAYVYLTKQWKATSITDKLWSEIKWSGRDFYGGRLGPNFNYCSIALFLKQGDGAMGL